MNTRGAMINSEQRNIIDLVSAQVRTRFETDGSGHDFEHVQRVFNTAVHIATDENADVFIVSLAALVHDLGDYKLSADGKENHRDAISAVLLNCGVSADDCHQVIDIVEKVSFKGNAVLDASMTTEGKCVRDADRLDAMGAIGVARAFAYGALKKRKMFDPDSKPAVHNSFDAYQKNEGHTINHFYEKLLLLKDRMETASGRAMAEDRHQFMLHFLDQFSGEWSGLK